MADRKSVRFQPDPLSSALMDLKNSKEFNPTIIGIILNESFKGCSIVVASDEDLKKDQKVKIKIGALDPLKGQIVWIKHLEENIYKIGVRLLE